MAKSTQAEKKNSYMHVHQAPKQVCGWKRNTLWILKNLPKIEGSSKAHHEHPVIP